MGRRLMQSVLAFAATSMAGSSLYSEIPADRRLKCELLFP